MFPPVRRYSRLCREAQRTGRTAGAKIYSGRRGKGEQLSARRRKCVGVGRKAPKGRMDPWDELDPSVRQAPTCVGRGQKRQSRVK